MTVSTRSSFPAPVDELLPQARGLVSRLGSIPSRNRLMAELHIGAPKAKDIRATLISEATEPDQAQEPDPEPTDDDDQAPEQPAAESTVEVPPVADPGVTTPTAQARALKPWPVFLIAAPAFVAIWVGWVGLGSLTGFGPVHPLPGIADDFTINSAITLPIGMEAYAAYALRVWLTPGLPTRARKFARWSALGALGLGMAAQAAYHLMVSAGMHHAPWQITTIVSCLPVAVLGLGAALAHLLRTTD